MGLWDALSGSIYKWNMTKLESTRRVCVGLKVFEGHCQQLVPQLQPAAAQSRDALYGFYVASISVISHNLSTHLSEIKSVLYNLSPDSLRCLISALHATQIVMRFHSPDQRGNLGILMGGVAIMYGRPDSFMNAWLSRAEWLRVDKIQGEADLIRAQYDEIAPIVGTFAYNAHYVRLWIDVGDHIETGMLKLLQDPTWHDVVTNEIESASRAKPIK